MGQNEADPRKNEPQQSFYNSEHISGLARVYDYKWRILNRRIVHVTSTKVRSVNQSPNTKIWPACRARSPSSGALPRKCHFGEHLRGNRLQCRDCQRYSGLASIRHCSALNLRLSSKRSSAWATMHMIGRRLLIIGTKPVIFLDD